VHVRRAALTNARFRVGQPYDAAAIAEQLQKYEASLRGQGFYEARATPSVDFVGNGAVVRISVDRGPHVSVAFAGDPLPEADRDRLVPIRARIRGRICSVRGTIEITCTRPRAMAPRRDETPGS
jgi:hypothetical protein